MRRVTLAELKKLALAAKSDLWTAAQGVGRDVKLYMHWTAGRYSQFFADYHINIDHDGGIYVSGGDLATVLVHTYRRNTGAVGIALAACYGATTTDLGEYAPTDVQIETLAQVVCVLADALDLTIDLQRVMTHGEAADNLDGLSPHAQYGPSSTCERWDLAILHTSDEWGSGGDIIRGKANWYREHGVGA